MRTNPGPRLCRVFTRINPFLDGRFYWIFTLKKHSLRHQLRWRMYNLAGFKLVCAMFNYSVRQFTTFELLGLN